MLIRSTPHVALQECSIDLKVSLEDFNPMWSKTLKEVQTGMRSPNLPVRLQVVLSSPRTLKFILLNGSVDDLKTEAGATAPGFLDL